MKSGHWSDGAVHNGPALPVGDCNCGGLELADYAGHSLVAPLVPLKGGGGLLTQDSQRPRLIETQELPADGLVARAPSPDLPDAHDGIAVGGNAASMHFHMASVAVVSDLQQAALSECFTRSSRDHVFGYPRELRHMDTASRNQRLREALEGMGLFVQPIFCESDPDRIDYMQVSVALPSFVEQGAQNTASGPVPAPVAGPEIGEAIMATDACGRGVINFPTKLR